MTDLSSEDACCESDNKQVISIGDIVIVTIHVHKQETGIVVYKTDDNSIFIRTQSDLKRISVSAKDIHKTVTIKQKVEVLDTKNKKETLSSAQIQQIIQSLHCNIIAQNYESGSDGFPIDFEKAMSWYKSGHKLKNIHCTVALANIFEDYYQNYDKAEQYWNVGIDLGYTHCAYGANIMFRKLTTPNAKHKELFYIRKYLQLTDYKNVGGLLDFAVCQLTMDIPDYSEAYKYLMKAYDLNRNSIGVQQFLAITVYRGFGCQKNENKAIEMHKELANNKSSECSMLWMSVYKAMNENIKNINNIHPLRENIYTSFMNVIENGTSHGLYYGNWIKINEYHALQKKDVMSCCVVIAFKIFGILQCDINVKDVKKCVINVMETNVDCICHWMKSWVWFFSERYCIINTVSGLNENVIDVLSEIELSILLSNRAKQN